MLNENLYELLETTFGRGCVKVISEDTEMHCRYIPVASQDNKSRGKHKLQISYGGEEYLVNCPFCSDTRYRCYINHRWGVYDQQTKTRNLWLWNCFNEGCQTEYENQKELFDNVYQGRPQGNKTVQEFKGKPRKKRKMEWPGDMWMFTDMLTKEPTHKALEYVRDRMYDPEKLAKHFNVGYCGFSRMSNAHDRIIAPVYLNGKLEGWQARLIGDPASKEIPKWWTSPGMRRSSVLYNYDNAIKHHTKVIVEGPGDVWGFGLSAVGIFGKAMTRDQIQLLADASKEDTAVVILLDPDQASDEKQKGKIHHIEKLYHQLSDVSKFRGKVLKAYLPSGYDPGDLDRDYMMRLIQQEAVKEDIDVRF
jgi:5S rRNA maturation endonuclease (ribonuclease M5)